MPVEALAKFFESIKEFVHINEEFITLLGLTYMNDAIDQDLLTFYLDRLGSGDLVSFEKGSINFYGFFSSITNVSYLEFERENTQEYLQRKLQDAKNNSIKSFLVLLSLLEKLDLDMRTQLENGLIPWMCTRIIGFEEVRPLIQLENQFEESSFDFAKMTYDQSVDSSAHFLRKLLCSGASRTDLKRIFTFIRTSDTSFEASPNHPKLNLDLATKLTLIVFILRADASIVPIIYISEVSTPLKS